MKNRIYVQGSWNCTMFMMMMNMEQLQKVSEGYSKVYNADYVGTDHGNFAALQPGEERIVTVAYLGLTKYQSKDILLAKVFYLQILQH